MKRAVLLTGHFPQQRRRASMLWVVEHLQAMGWHVTIATVGYSWLSVLRRDPRLRALGRPPARGRADHSPTLTALYSLSALHPVNLGPLNPLAALLMPGFVRHWRPCLRGPLSEADLVICESGAPVLLGPLVAELAPQAARIYRVSDDIGLLNAPPVLRRAEAAHHHFTRISTASPRLARRFAEHPNVTLDANGVPAAARQETRDPYPSHTRPIAVCAGTTQVDTAALLRIAGARPRWDIHVLGRLRARPPQAESITWHGEQEFETTLAHIAHADIGLAPYVDAPGVEYQTTNSNRILLYRHFGLPTLGPDRLCDPAVPSIIGYGDARALDRCEMWKKRPEPIPDWSRLARALAQNRVTDPPEVVSTAPETTVNPRVRTVPPFASTA